MTKAGIPVIELAASPCGSNVVIVRKKDNSLRFCVDYQQLNCISKEDSYPLPLIDDCLNTLEGSSWLTRNGCHRFTVMRFGLTGRPVYSNGKWTVFYPVYPI